VTIYLPDVSVYQAGISLSGALAVAIKYSEGTGYLNPARAEQSAEASRHDAFEVAYHFLHQGQAAQQAVFAHAHAGSTPAMVDAEPLLTLDGKVNRRSAVSRDAELAETVDMASRPVIADICEYVDAYRAAGGVIHWVYLPHWWWQALGSPSLKPLTDRGLLLWSSDYTSYSDSNGGAGWQPYGGMTPTVWQYTMTEQFGGVNGVDFSAYRGSKYAGHQDPASVGAALAEFISLSRTGKLPAPPANTLPPVRNLRCTAVGKTTAKLQWDSPGPSKYVTGWYQVTVRQDGRDLPAYPRTFAKGADPEVQQIGSLPLQELAEGQKLTVLVRAVDTPAKTHASAWSTLEIPS
jgi:GH25 family lysozyme M1 (1,4-beta-N-acetylmuramidase)